MNYCIECKFCNQGMGGTYCESPDVKTDCPVNGKIRQSCIVYRKPNKPCVYFEKKIIKPKKKTLLERIFNL